MKKIYVVEDDQGIREVLEVFLGLENFEVQSFASVSEFKKRDTASHPDLYLFDVRLPDGSGTDLCQHVKSIRGSKSIPVIMMSAHASVQDISLRCSPDDIIPKPFDIVVLLERIRAVLKT
ncbi:response regulator transcription factor [Epilithonimonas zeae]|uniref:Response regulator receiver domain-containing protein n=1 Tax=Epilithonimonas zeae TaxID=1416779 RepID=A0A1N6GT67_9FLAO|nr:response regulator transcription factor [Epilithonimonas zeae]UQB69813.1 response regulator transcription factor [Epilithonimonas zeae]SIO10764.1 Response regulator receiver domain-containing protein [Epilithonimonas zeae]